MFQIERAKSDSLDKMLGTKYPILDHGFIRIIDYMGNDTAIDEAARLSYGSGTRKTSETQGLLNYLMSHGHTSPFEMCELKLHVKLPIFVMRQWVRHRMANLNEYSARYSVLNNEFYLPSLDQLKQQSKTNNQGRDEPLSFDMLNEVDNSITRHSLNSYKLYEYLLEDDINLSRELARMTLPVNFYTEMYWKIDLHNLLHFLKLRNDSHAQYEIKVYAEFIENIVVKDWVPLAHNAFTIYKKNALTFSGKETPLIRLVLSRFDYFKTLEESPMFTVDDENYRLTNREWKEFLIKLQKL